MAPAPDPNVVEEGPEWRILLVQSNDLTLLGDLTKAGTGKSLSLSLNKPGNVSFSMPMDHDMAGLIQPHTTGIMARRKGSTGWQTIWSGEIQPIDEDASNNRMTVSAVGWWDILYHRFIRQKKIFTNTDDGAIIMALLTEMNTTPAPDGYAILTPGSSNPNTPTWLLPGGTKNNEWTNSGGTAYVTALRDMNGIEPYTMVGTIIDQLVNLENGCDLELDPETRTLYAFRRKERVLPNVLFGFNWGPHNLQQFGRNIDGTTTVNYFLATGLPQHAPRYQDVGLSQYAFRLREETIALSDYKDESTLQAYAAAEIALRAGPRITYSITPFPFGGEQAEGRVPEPFVDYRLGDTIYFSAKWPPRINIQKQAARIFGITVNIDENGNERISPLSIYPGA